MGDSSECYSANTSHLSLPTDIKFMDNVTDSEEDEAVKKPVFSSGNRNYLNGDIISSNDVFIQIDDLDTPVPVCPDTDASCSDTNGHDENCILEPKISPSEALGREANGFDEAAEVEGSEEEVRTGSPTGSSDAWAEDNISDDDSNHSFDRDFNGRRSKLMISHNSMTSRIPYKQFHNVEDDRYDGKSNIFGPNGSSNIHRSLYADKQFEMQEFVGRGENSSPYNYTGAPDGDKHLRTLDTYQASASSSRRPPPSSKSEIDKPVSFNSLHSTAGRSFGFAHRQSTGYSSMIGLGPSPKLISNPRNPLPSSCSPSISGSSSRPVLPYETPDAPPFGNPVDESRLRQSVVELLPAKGISSEAPCGMPRGEPIPFDENEPDASGNEVESAKKKKKKKKRSGNKSGDLATEADKKASKNVPPSGVSTLDKAMTDTVQESRAQHYPPIADGGSSVMENSQRSKAKQSGKAKKKTELKSYTAKDIDGNRGSEDIDSLLHFVEGKKPKSGGKAVSGALHGSGGGGGAGTGESKKKQKKQKVVTRLIAANSSAYEQGKSTPYVMGSVVETAVVTTEESKLCVSTSSSALPVSGSGVVAAIDSSTLECVVPLKVDGSGDQSATIEGHAEKMRTDSSSANDKPKPTDSNSPSDPVTVKIVPVTEPETKRMEADVGTKEPGLFLTGPSPSAVSDLEFTNFEGLIDQYSEQPFEKYVGRKKKSRQPQQQQPSQYYRQGYSTNSSYGHTRGRWPPTNQANNMHLNSSTNRVHGNGLSSHSSQSPHSQVGATNKLPANQSVSRYPPTSTPQSFAAKASSSRGPLPVTSDQQQRKPAGPAGQSPCSPPSVAVPSVKSPPPKEEFPPLRPSADAQTLKKEISPTTSATTATTTTTTSSSPASSSSSSSTSSFSSSSVPNKNTSTVVSSTAPTAAGSAELKAAGDRRDAPSVPSKYFDSADMLKIKQFIEMLYPKPNEMCYFYSENAKRCHFLKMSAKHH